MGASTPIDWRTQPLRALLFVPGNNERQMRKVASFGSDAVVLDLEDAVADDEKTAARATAREALSYVGEGEARRPVVFIRVNGVSTGRQADDVAAVVAPGLDAIMVPKVESAQMLLDVDEQITAAEQREGIEPGTIRILPIIETALGIVNCESILMNAPARVFAPAFGLGDFSTDIAVDLTREGDELFYAKGRIVVAARAAGMRPPIDGPIMHIFDDDLLREDTRRSRGLGFMGRVAVYPRQAPVIHEAFSWLPDEEVALNRKVVEEFEAAEREGVASIRVDGNFVDYPLYDRAKAKLAIYDAYIASLEEN